MTDTTTEIVAEPVVEPAVAAQPEPVVEPPPTESEPQQESEPVVTEHGNKGKKPWFLDRISQESHRAQTAEERAAAAERRASEAEALLQRTQSGTTTTTERSAPAQMPQQELDRLVDERANQKRFFEDTTAVKNAGLQKFGAQFENDLNILNAIGATNNDMVADILAVDKANAHIMLNRLAADPEKAAVLAKMDTRTRIAELTRLQMAPATAPVKEPAKSAPKQVSKAPAPPPPVEPGASKTIDWRSDDATDADFSRGWNEHMSKRTAKR